ncbi:MAG: hypothetical protein J6B50_12835 [Lachnospiraceae bacterium]|nr:hypothetical protein [Lachnospiraceae bacterium]MBP3507305.1 hypothetical protein [Lachnospiraceae bacterium]
MKRRIASSILIIGSLVMSLTGCTNPLKELSQEGLEYASDNTTNTDNEVNDTKDNNTDSNQTDGNEIPTWVTTYDFNQLEDLSAPNDLSICGAHYPFSIESLKNDNVCINTMDFTDDYKCIYEPFDSIIGKEQQHVPIYYLGVRYDYDEAECKRNTNATAGSMDDTTYMMSEFGTMTYINGDDPESSTLLFTEDSHYCISKQYPYNPYVIQAKNYPYVEDEYGNYYENGFLWYEDLLVSTLGKPTKIYGNYSKLSTPFQKDATDDEVNAQKNYIMYFEYDEACILFHCHEVYKDDKHLIGFDSVEIYDSKESFDIMAGYLDDWTDITSNVFESFQ